MPKRIQRVLKGYGAVLARVVPVLHSLLPNVVAGMVAVLEHGFLYSYTLDELFAELSPSEGSSMARVPLLGKIFLWHWFEEREHCTESSYLFFYHYKSSSVPYLLLAVAPASFFWFTTKFVGLLMAVLAQPFRLPFHLIDFLRAVVADDSFILASVYYLLMQSWAKTEHTKEQIQAYANRYKKLYGDDMFAEKVFLTGDAA